jgi:hypothetical protein
VVNEIVSIGFGPISVVAETTGACSECINIARHAKGI